MTLSLTRSKLGHLLLGETMFFHELLIDVLVWLLSFNCISLAQGDQKFWKNSPIFQKVAQKCPSQNIYAKVPFQIPTILVKI
jgi:hypothetical protein